MCIRRQVHINLRSVTFSTSSQDLKEDQNRCCCRCKGVQHCSTNVQQIFVCYQRVFVFLAISRIFLLMPKGCFCPMPGSQSFGASSSSSGQRSVSAGDRRDRCATGESGCSARGGRGGLEGFVGRVRNQRHRSKNVRNLGSCPVLTQKIDRTGFRGYAVIPVVSFGFWCQWLVLGEFVYCECFCGFGCFKSHALSGSLGLLNLFKEDLEETKGEGVA